MRLLKASEYPLRLQNFYDRNVPAYAILSHTWSENPEEEVLYADVISGTACSKSAFNKIQACMREAVDKGYEYCWVDTCRY